ncbi:MAG: hypothetical protein COA49_02690 [Bacteroidetes bacterium]|nr:MAG: hypothetical protein COA49_02690 [Bacteroidota bacterium]
MTSNKTYDYVIIGGGIHGVGVAQAAAAAGYSVLVLEQTALANGTSSKSSKLIHGGLRYLETAQIKLVFECLSERALLLELAPDIVRLEPFYIPIYKNTTRRPWEIWTGLSLYSVLGKLKSDTRFESIPENKWSGLDGLATENLQAVFRYNDGATDDAALTRAVMKSASTLGAELVMPATFISSDASKEMNVVNYSVNGTIHSCKCRLLVNAAGPWANLVLDKVNPTPKKREFDLIAGAHIVIDSPPPNGMFYVEAPQDRRAVFVMPWKGKTMIGTTETAFNGDPSKVRPLESEETYLCEVAAHYFPKFKDLTRENIDSSFAGLRVLPHATGKAFSRPRETTFHVDKKLAPRIITIYGGKLTAFRITSEKFVAKFANMLPKRKRKAWTNKLKLKPVLSLITAIFLSTISTTTTLAQTSPTELSLEGALEIAKESSYSMRIAKYRELEAETTRKQVLASGLPHINGTIDYNNFIEIPTQVAPADAFAFPDYLNTYLYDLGVATGVPINAPPVDPNAISEFQFGSPQSASIGFTATQLIFSGSYIVALQVAKVFEESKAITTAKTEVETIKAVSFAYHTCLAAARNVETLRSALKLTEKVFQETKAMAEEGFIESNDVDVIELSVRKLKHELANSELQQELTLSLLLFQIGLPVDTKIELTDTMEGLRQKMNIEFEEIDVAESPSVMEQRYLYELSDWNFKSKKMSSLPTISGFYTNSQNAQRDVFNMFDFNEKWYPTQLWGLQIKMPLFGSFEGKHIRKKALVQTYLAATALELATQAAELELSAARAEFKRATSSILEAESNVQLASRIYDNVTLAHNEGVKSSFELTQAQNDLLSGEGILIGSQLNWLNAHARLKAATTTISK